MLKSDFLSKGDPLKGCCRWQWKRGTNKKVMRCEVILVTKNPLMAFAKIIKLYCMFVSVLAPSASDRLSHLDKYVTGSLLHCLCVEKERFADEIAHCFILECQIGFYRNADRISKCLPCPTNSASNTGRTGCTCDKGYYSSSDEADCKGILIVNMLVIITD